MLFVLLTYTSIDSTPTFLYRTERINTMHFNDRLNPSIRFSRTKENHHAKESHRHGNPVPKKSPTYDVDDIRRALKPFSPAAFVIGRSADVARGLYETCTAIQVYDPYLYKAAIFKEADKEDFQRQLTVCRHEVQLRCMLLGNTIAYSKVETPEFDLEEIHLADAYTGQFIREQSGIRHLSFGLNKKLIDATYWDAKEKHPDSVRTMFHQLFSENLVIEKDIPVVREFRRYFAVSKEEQHKLLPTLLDLIQKSSNPKLFIEHLQ